MALAKGGDEVGAGFAGGDDAAATGTDATESLGPVRIAGPGTAEIMALASFADRLSGSPPSALSQSRAPSGVKLRQRPGKTRAKTWPFTWKSPAVFESIAWLRSSTTGR